MKFVSYDNIYKYTDIVMDYLAVHEIQNNLLISNCLKGKEGADTSDWFMGTVADSDGGLQLIALMTPPFNLVIYEVNNKPCEKAVEILSQEIINSRIEIPGAMAESSLAKRFTDKYSSISGKRCSDGMKMGVYRLDDVNDNPKSPGRMRNAEQDEMYFLPYWQMGFSLDCGFKDVTISASADRVRKLLEDRNLYIWEDGIPVSQAAAGRKTLNGAVVSAVFTPPYYRGKGYASSCVSSLSRHLLDSGYKFCCLFTDLGNPISNGIYMKMGYKPVGEYTEYSFKESGR